VSTVTEKKQKFRIVDNPNLSETFSNKFVGSMFDGSTITLTLGTIRFMPRRTDDAPQTGDHPEVFVNNRLAITPAVAVEIVNSLNQMLGAIAAHPNPVQIVPAQPSGQQSH